MLQTVYEKMPLKLWDHHPPNWLHQSKSSFILIKQKDGNEQPFFENVQAFLIGSISGERKKENHIACSTNQLLKLPNLANWLFVTEFN